MLSLRILLLFVSTASFATLLLPSAASSEHADLTNIRFGEGALAFSAGFIRQAVPAIGTVAKTQDSRQVVGKGDLVHLRMKGPEEVSAGDRYTLYRRIHKVFHPITRHYLGDLIYVIGVVRVTEVQGGFVSARVERSYASIAPGDGVMPFSLPSDGEPELSERVLPDTPGTIVDVQVPRTLIAQRHLVYLDWGREDGLRIGDRLEVFRARPGWPVQVIGEVKVLALEDQTATGIIVRSTAPFVVGDRFTAKKPAKGTAYQPVTDRTESPVSKAHRELTESLKSEIEKGDISIIKVGETVTINLGDLVDQLEYESGEAQIKSTGFRILKQISDILKTVKGKRIIVEGHTDNMPISPRLMRRFRTNQELSEARANLIVRYFMDEGIDPASLSAIGYADRRPVASNATEEGRRKNRRIEIELSSMEPSEPDSVGTAQPIAPAAIEEPQPTDAEPSQPTNASPETFQEPQP